MNTRVLELIKNPKIITENDLQILESESVKMPYAQSIRALYLYGINLYQSENYKEHLSKTAAYTTDKKILYQFIKSEKISKNSEVYSNPAVTELPIENQENILENDNRTVPEIIPETTSKIVENQTDEVIGEDLQAIDQNNIEAGHQETTLVKDSDTSEAELIEGNRLINSAAEILPEENISNSKEIIEEETIQEITDQESENLTEISSSDISFGGIQDFLPEVKFSVPKNHLDYLNPPKKETRLEKPLPIVAEKRDVFIEKIPVKELIIENQNSLSFENTQAFDVIPQEEKEANVESEVSFEKIQTFDIEKEINQNQEKRPEPLSEWKPMTFATHTPDALIGQSEKGQAEIPTLKEEVSIAQKIEEVITDEEKTTDQTAEAETIIQDSEMPVFNVSFFGNEVEKLEEEKEQIIENKETVDNTSNIGAFINTWQSWLKIERKEPAVEQAKAKEKIIDNFIETNPKISQLKEESSYVVKEKKDDISHLMTETLAKLYAEQKLYSKAIKAYEILSEKHPHKKDYFLEKIEEVKEIRKP